MHGVIASASQRHGRPRPSTCVVHTVVRPEGEAHLGTRLWAPGNIARNVDYSHVPTCTCILDIDLVVRWEGLNYQV